VEFFTRTGIAAAGGQFDFERCARKMFVNINKKVTCLCSYILGKNKKKKRERQYWVHSVLAVRYLPHKQGLLSMSSINL
jgi:hypothetical protein